MAAVNLDLNSLIHNIIVNVTLQEFYIHVRVEEVAVKTARRTNLWAKVEQIILNHYDSFKSPIDPSKLVRLRGSYYTVREYLKRELASGAITQEEFDHYLDQQGYATYRDDLWPDIEQTHGLERPEAKPIGVIYNQGDELPISKFEDVYYRVRGFIFVEKADEAEMLKPISEHGWAIIAGQGFSTRLIRHLFKEDGRPVLALHDCDKAGEDIYRVFGEGSRRTKHLDLLIKRTTDLGLKEEDALKLNLQSQPEAPKFRKTGRNERYELSALNALKVSYGIENPVLAYTVAKMRIQGIRISPTPEEIPLLMKQEVEKSVEKAFQEVSARIRQIADFPTVLADDISQSMKYPEGEAVEVEIPGISELKVDLDQPIGRLVAILESEIARVKPELTSQIEKSIQRADIVDEKKYEAHVVKRLGDDRIYEMLA